MHGRVASLSLSPVHGFSKTRVTTLVCLKGQGVEGDAHCGTLVRHRSRVAVDPSQPNLRQVHLIPSELLAELCGKGFAVAPGSLGENITTSGVDLLQLPRNALLQFAGGVLLRVTGLRNPCAQIEAFSTGLLREMIDKDPFGNVVRRAGVMAVVDQGGVIRVGEAVSIIYPVKPYHPLERV